jgi:hypothetical protein
MRRTRLAVHSINIDEREISLACRNFHTLTSMFQPMPSQGDPRFLYSNAMLLASLVSTIKLSAVQVFESGHSDSKVVNAGIVFFC